MSTLGLATVAALVAAGLVALVLRVRRRRVARPPGPRTVADLVQLRADAPAVVGSAPKDAAAVGSGPSAETPTAPAGIDVPAGQDEAAVVVARASAEPAADQQEGDRGAAPRPALNGSGDTPWSRARRMAGAEDAEPLTTPEVVESSAVERADAAEDDPAVVRSDAPAVVEGQAVPEAGPQLKPEQEPVVEPEPVVAEQTVPALSAGPAANPDLPVPQGVSEPAGTSSPSEPRPDQDDTAQAVETDPAAETDPADAGRPSREAGPDRPPLLRLVPPLPAPTTIPEPRAPISGPEPAVTDADLAVLGTLGLVDPRAEPAPVLAPSGVDGRPDGAEEPSGPARQIRFRVSRHDGSAVAGAAVSLLDARGREIITGYTDAQGAGELAAPHPGSYLLLAGAPDHQPGAAAISVADGPAEAGLLLVRSAVLTGSVRGPYGPIMAARLTLVQDGEIVDAAHSDPAGEYRIPGLAAGRYGLSATAPGCLPVAVRIDLDAEAELRREVELARDPAAAREIDADPMTMPIPVQSRAAAREAVGHR